MNQEAEQKTFKSLEEVAHHFKIKLGPTGQSRGNTIEMDGKILLGVQDLVIRCTAEGLTTVELKVLAKVEVEIEPSATDIFRRKPERFGLGNPNPLWDGPLLDEEASPASTP